MITLATGLVFALAWNGVEAADTSQPHPHQGEIPRLKMDGKPSVTLSSADMKQIEAGELWMWSKEMDGIGRGIGIRDIAAPPEIVWGQIADIEGYVGKVPMLSSLKIYSKEKNVEKATYKVKVIPGYYFEYYVEHLHSKDKRTLLFYLDYDRSSDFNDLQGKWYLENHPTKAGWTRVYYQCDLKLWGYAPKIVKTLLTSQGLSSSIGWVKRESEKRAPKDLVEGAEDVDDETASRSMPMYGILAAVLALILVAAVVRRRRHRRR